MTEEEELEHVNLCINERNTVIRKLGNEISNLEFFILGMQAFINNGQKEEAFEALDRQVKMIQKRYKK